MKKQNIYSILLLSSLLLFVTQLSLAEANPYIIDDSTGGDCNLIGAWNSDTKTCTLTQDVNQATIQIVSDGVTLDGGGHTITPPGNGVYFNAVVYLSGRTNVTVENLKIVGQSDNPRTGVGLVNSQNNILRNISSSNNYNGIVLDYSDHNTLTGNNSSNNACFGISLGHSTYNTLTGNTSSSNDILYGCQPCGIVLYAFSNNNTLTDNISSDHSLNGDGICLISILNNNTLTGNISSNNRVGIYLDYYSTSNTLTRNTSSNNKYGIILTWWSGNNKIYNNKFIGNTMQAYVAGYSYGNVFNLDSPIGGNYWDNFDQPGEGCVDSSPLDGFCDSAYVFTGGRDNLPWVLNLTSPVALCKDVTAVADADCRASASVDNGSYDPSGGPITLSQSPAGPYLLGITPVTLTVTNNQGLSSQCTANVTVVDNAPPTINSMSVNPAVLWPPRHQMVAVAVTASATDNCTATPVCSITSVTSNEPVNGLGDGDTAPDGEITGNLTMNLRAERSGTGSGRIYTLTGSCADASGNSSLETMMVRVPKSQGRQK